MRLLFVVASRLAPTLIHARIPRSTDFVLQISTNSENRSWRNCARSTIACQVVRLKGGRGGRMSIQSTGLGKGERKTYTVDEAAKLLGIGRNSAYAEIKTGRLAGVSVIKVGSRLLLPKLALDRVLAGESP